jgi:hypothetical protein
MYCKTRRLQAIGEYSEHRRNDITIFVRKCKD